MKKYKRALFIFRRDLRLEDNSGLLFALEQAQEVIACFIFTPEQIEKNPFFSERCLQFMLESLLDLEEALQGRLYLFYGHPEAIVGQCFEKRLIDCVVVNRDYTPYSQTRDLKIEAVCKRHKASFFSLDDVLLHTPEALLKKDGTPYTIFTPFFRHAREQTVPLPRKNTYRNYYSDPISFSVSTALYERLVPSPIKQFPGGRQAGLQILKNLHTFAHYKKLRDYPAENGTTHLSAHLKFTTLSPRELYHAISSQLGDNSELIRALYWREFFTNIAYYFPHVFSGAFHEKYNKLAWNYDKALFKKWCEGMTGFPLVDAGMRELNHTGYMHNRVRMLVACFLAKHLHINWQLGEKYFAQHLIDYDPALNNGNWQWAASTGCDAMPYFRIFNPWTQSYKFDRECLYIKRWIPELERLSPKIIHSWHNSEYHEMCPEYPAPIIEHSKEAKIALESYKKLHR